MDYNQRGFLTPDPSEQTTMSTYEEETHEQHEDVEELERREESTTIDYQVESTEFAQRLHHLEKELSDQCSCNEKHKTSFERLTSDNEGLRLQSRTLVVDETSEERNKARLAISELALMTNVPMALYAVIRLNVADAIWNDGANAALTPDHILSRITPPGAPADPENLQRILRMLSSYGVFNECLSPITMERRYSLTEVGKTLVTDGEGLSYGAYVLQHNLDAMMKAWPLMHTVVLDPSTEPFVRANGDPPYTYYRKDEEMNKLMQRAMSGASVPFMRALLGSGYDGFDRVGTLVDVGGSAGDCLRIILEKYSDIKEAINFDLPEVLAKAPRIPGITYVGGDMFKSIPRGDVVFEKLIFLTWTDDEVKQIIKTVMKRCPREGN